MPDRDLRTAKSFPQINLAISSRKGHRSGRLDDTGDQLPDPPEADLRACREGTDELSAVSIEMCDIRA